MSEVMQLNPLPTDTARSHHEALLLDVDVALARLEDAIAGKPSEAPFTPISALAEIARIFALTPASTEILALVAGGEIDKAAVEQFERLGGVGRLTVELVLATCADAAFDALCPEGALRRWRIVELVGNGALVAQQLTVDERVIHHLVGNSYLDSRLEGLLHREWTGHEVSPSTVPLVDAMVHTWSDTDMGAVVRLGGRDRRTRRQTAAAAAAAALGYHLLRIDAADVPTDWTQRHGLATFTDREMALSKSVVMIETDPEHCAVAAQLAEALLGPVVVSAEDPPSVERSAVIRIDLPEVNVAERRELWQTAFATFGIDSASKDSGPDRLAEQFAATPATIEAAFASALAASPNGTPLFEEVWRTVRKQCRRSLEGLADRIECHARWGDLVPPAQQLSQLQDLTRQVNEAWRVNGAWGWGNQGSRGLGTAALFAGASGTGKTLAAEVIAGELGLDLYRIDLSQILSKWIGETEKNLSAVFTAADDAGAVLLFDEADALFSKRTDVKDSHDRYANVEVSYLLQRMEDYRGLALLTTNLRSSIDKAFLRRLRHVVTFPFPDAELRAEMWARVFPADTPTVDLDPAALSRLNIAGGSIRSIALNATYLAAADHSPVGVSHVATAARREFEKLDKPFGTAELGALL